MVWSGLIGLVVNVLLVRGGATAVPLASRSSGQLRVRGPRSKGRLKNSEPKVSIVIQNARRDIAVRVGRRILAGAAQRWLVFGCDVLVWRR
jgi:hypothetical protein